MHRQRGVALLIVLWACALLAIVLGGFALVARTEGMQARNLDARVRARYAAEAGIARAVAALQRTRMNRRWVADGRSYRFRFDGAKVRVSITDERGKVDINAASTQTLAGLFHAAGLNHDRAQALAEAVADWRDADNAVRPHGAEAAQYQAAGRDYGPRNAPFLSIEELQQVLGMNAALYRRVAPDITVWTSRPVPDATHAPAAVLQALTGMDATAANSYVQSRHRLGVGNNPLPALPGLGSPGVMTGNGGVQSIRSTATVAGGVRFTLRVTVRLRGGLHSGPPYSVLHWQEGRGEDSASAGGGHGSPASPSGSAGSSRRTTAVSGRSGRSGGRGGGR